MPLTSGQLQARLHRMARHVEHWGDVRALDYGSKRGRFLLELELAVPGGDLRPEATAVYREYYDGHGPASWELVKYTYEYFDLVRFWRLGYHLHPIGGTAPVAHAHCDQEATSITEEEGTQHYRATAYDLREANAAFMRLYAAGLPPDCDALLPVEVDRG